MNILIIDDDKFLLDMYSLKFNELGFQVSTATDGEEALEKVTNGLNPDIFLIDILMPKLDGFQFIAKLKEKNLPPETILIILSNMGQQADIDQGLALGVDGYIVKATATPSEVVSKTVDIANSKHAKNKKV
ncbi:response regulator [Candidatus Nomurabacteria bacterium]|nr:response regulator [Candidatus Nomurabacteria bacterium]